STALIRSRACNPRARSAHRYLPMTRGITWSRSPLFQLDARSLHEYRVVGDFLAEIGVELLGRIVHRLDAQARELLAHVGRLQRIDGFLVEAGYNLRRRFLGDEHPDPEGVVRVGAGGPRGGGKVRRREGPLRGAHAEGRP